MKWGVTPAGFVAKQQQQIIADIDAALQATFGANVNLGAESVLGQLVGVFSEREALLWALAEAVYASQYPAGAEGVAVDNILALNNLVRLAATATVTDPTPAIQPSGVPLYGLVLYGEPGTVVEAGSQLKTNSAPVLTFTLDADVEIAAAVDAQQNLMFSNVPTSGLFALVLTGPTGDTLTTVPLRANCTDTQTFLTWPTPPTSGRMFIMLEDKVAGPIEYTAAATGLLTRLAALGGDYVGLQATGSFSDGFALQWSNEIFNALVNVSPTLLTFSAAPTTGSFTLTVGGQNTAALPYTINAVGLQNAIRAVGYPRALVGTVVPNPDNLLPANVRTGTDFGASTAGFFGCRIDDGYATHPSPILSPSSDTSWQGEGSLLVASGESGRGGAGVRVPVQAGQTYTFSAYVKAHDVGVFALATAVAFNASAGAIAAPTNINAASWTQLSQTFTVPLGQTSVQVMLGGSGLLFYTDGWALKVGAAATAWSDTTGVQGFGINFVGEAAAPVVSVANHTLANADGDLELIVAAGYTLNQPVAVSHSLQAAISNLYDEESGTRPFSDVHVSASGLLFNVAFGAGEPQAGEPKSGAMPQPVIRVAQNNLQSDGTATNLAVAQVTPGSLAQGIGAATCTVTGPNAVRANQLCVIGSPTPGWTAVKNQLDALPGRETETDTAALVRRSNLASAQAKGPLQSIVDHVLQVPGVTGAIGFANNTAAAQQVLSFAAAPTNGTYQLVLGAGTTAPLNFDATAADLQTAINAVPGYSAASVTGGAALGFLIDFNGAAGAQWQPLVQVVNNSTGIAAAVSYGRAPKSFEVVVEGGAPANIAAAIYGAMPAGIASYGSPAAQTLATLTQGSNIAHVVSAAGVVAGQAMYGMGVANGAVVTAVAGTAITMSAVALSSQAYAPVLFSYGAQVNDAYGNPVFIKFSRPTPVLFFVTVALVTDQYRTPGVPSSGINPQSKFQPASIAQIQADLAGIGNATPIGGLVVAFGTHGLVGGFNEVPGVVGYTINFGVSPTPTGAENVQMLPTQIATFEEFNISVSWI